MEQQPDDFLEVALLGQGLDAVSSVLEDPDLAVDEADGGVGGGNAGQSGYVVRLDGHWALHGWPGASPRGYGPDLRG